MAARGFQHVAWPELPRLAARLLLFEAQLVIRHSVRESKQQRAAAAVVDMALKVAGADADGLDGSAPRLQQYFERFYDVLHRQFARSSGTSASELLLRHIAAGTRAATCVACNNDRVCEGLATTIDADDDIVARYGKCIAGLKLLFRFAIDETTAFYKRYAPSAPAPTVHFCTELDQRRPGSSRISFMVDGRTARVGSGTLDADVFLILRPGYRLRCFLATLYVLFHECVAHAFSGLPLDTEESSRSVAFCEGWMDWIAVELLKQSLVVPFSRKVGALEIPGAIEKIRDAGERLHGERSDEGLDESDPESAMVAHGKEAAMALYGVFQRVQPKGSTRWDAWKQFAAFSTRVNASAAPDDFREELVWAVSCLVPASAAEQEWASARARTVKKSVRDFASHGDAMRLAREIINAKKVLQG